MLFVHTATLPPLGADTWVHAQIIRDLDRSSHEVHAACVPWRHGGPTPTYEALRRIPDVWLLSVDLGPERSAGTSARSKLRAGIATVPAVGSVLRLARYVRRHHISVIHTSDRPRDSLACLLVARMTGAKCIIHCHVGFGDWMSRLLTRSMRRADAVIAVSQFVARSLAPLKRRDEQSTYVVLNAIDPDDWQPGLARAQTRQELGLGDETPVIITVCRLFPGKGPAELIRAVGSVREALPDVRLLVVGEDVTPGGRYRRELEDLVTELELDQKVIFTGRRDDVPRLMAAADVFAMASLEEPFGLVYLEAMAMTLPVVALDSGGTPEVVEHARSGLLTRPGDTDGLAGSLVTLLCNPDLRRRMGMYGRRAVEHGFTTERMARDVAEVYRSVAGRADAGAGELEGAGHAGLVGG